MRKVVELCKMRCSGRLDKINSPLLHLHEQLLLLEKTRTYFEEIRGTILPPIKELLNTNATIQMMLLDGSCSPSRTTLEIYYHPHGVL